MNDLLNALRKALSLKGDMFSATYDPDGKRTDVFGYADDVGAAKPAVGVSATLLSSAWTGSTAPYTQTASVTDLAAATNGAVGLSQSATAEQRAAAREAMLCVTAQANGSLTVTADGVKPTADIPITVTILG